jgi:PEP-CTERM motif
VSNRLLTVLLMLGFAGTCSRLSADSFTLGTLPSDGKIAGLAGSTIGWGYTITNNSASDWLVTDAVNADAFLNLNGLPNVLFDFPIVAPLATVSVPYDSIGGLGLYEITWDAAAPAGFVNSGTFTLTGEWWDNNPFNGGNPIDAPTEDESAAYSATVSPAVSSVPEPSTLALLCIGLAMIAFRSRKRLGRT